jgi:hypothetical protein
MLSVLKYFPRLRQLGLPSVTELEIGVEGGIICGNIYSGPEGREYGRREVQQGAEAVESAAKIVLDSLPHLETLEIGKQWAKISKQDGGATTAIWPWTGRMTEHTYDIWPEDTRFDQKW